MSNREASVFPLDHGDWEAGMLDGGKEGIDETSLKMEMKTSMDIHRLMRLRQKVRRLQPLPRRWRRPYQMSAKWLGC